MKKTNLFRLTGMILLLLAASALLFSCQNQPKKSAEKRMEEAIEEATGEDADVDLEKGEATIKTEEGEVHVSTKKNKWPDEIPGDVPEFTYGDMLSVTTTDIPEGYGWTITYENVPDDAIEKYDAELKKSGFETLVAGMGSRGSISGEKGNVIVGVMSGDGMASVSVAIEE